MGFLGFEERERENTLMVETIPTGVRRRSVLTVRDYEVCQGFLQLIITGSQKKYKDNLEEGLEKFLLVPERVQYLACLHRRASDVVNVLICDRHLSAAQTLFELADQSFFPLGSGQLLTS